MIVISVKSRKCRTQDDIKVKKSYHNHLHSQYKYSNTYFNEVVLCNLRLIKKNWENGAKLES